mmetsp:Transcript_17312/g.28954  ORF Transcript_17312/g.28954 Transcript_17312/m.28954 type:complete len:317 (+) Transcript_17312:116-1066(+)|eukprot:CAMPEP_0114430430 /NCGR_PEP_ID=MMETSP0103-20121206/10036_1 /TAXON_ID=37642 ORGANISM="Paraphysomonas imperforata, Strain PA2" /NCGR_SAMPLE_ID=MMETSP0103 /ASSEMBLY_ACC=CAM_ASM_000201 /LENGTH=316 /DNA_ID=CAMNT_0001599875 /DNA_START=113 /DNA_END=1063 /DNA_ORIENTATION=-
MKILGSINSWFTKRVSVVEDEFIIDSLFIYFILDIFSWSFAFEEEKMYELLKFLRLEKSKPSVGSTANVQNYIENTFDMTLGSYEADCLLKYIGLCGGKGDQILLLPYTEEVSKRKWCQQLDQKALGAMLKAQKKKKKIKKSDIRDYRALVRKRRTSAVCNVRVINHKKESPFEDTLANTDHVYDFTLTKTKENESSDLFQKTQSVIDSINKLNYLSDSASDFSSFSRQSSISGISEDYEGGGIFGDDFSLEESNMATGAFKTDPSELEEVYRTKTDVSSFDPSPEGEQDDASDVVAAGVSRATEDDTRELLKYQR